MYIVCLVFYTNAEIELMEANPIEHGLVLCRLKSLYIVHSLASSFKDEQIALVTNYYATFQKR